LRLELSDINHRLIRLVNWNTICSMAGNRYAVAVSHLPTLKGADVLHLKLPLSGEIARIGDMTWQLEAAQHAYIDI
jgi:hypothetical protein